MTCHCKKLWSGPLSVELKIHYSPMLSTLISASQSDTLCVRSNLECGLAILTEMDKMGRRTGPWHLNPHRVPHDTIQANGPCNSSIKSHPRTFPGLPARPGFCHSITTTNQEHYGPCLVNKAASITTRTKQQNTEKQHLAQKTTYLKEYSHKKTRRRKCNSH